MTSKLWVTFARNQAQDRKIVNARKAAELKTKYVTRGYFDRR
jgi:hypothetical protein